MNFFSAQLKAKVPFDTILDGIQESVWNPSEVTRLHLTTKKDLHNLMQEYSMSFTERRSQNDKESVQIIIDEHQDKFGETSPFKFYKSQGTPGPDGTEKEDMILIIMTPFGIEVLSNFFFIIILLIIVTIL